MICRDIIGCCPRDYRRGSDVPDSLVSRYDAAHTLALEEGRGEGGGVGGGSDDAGKAWRRRVEERRRHWKEGDGAMVEGRGGRKGIIYYAVSMSLTMTASSILVTRRLSWRPISADHR